MAGNNPVFSRIEKQMQQQGYAGFGRQNPATPRRDSRRTPRRRTSTRCTVASRPVLSRPAG